MMGDTGTSTTPRPRPQASSMRRPRAPAPGETLVPRGFEQVAHPLFLLMRGPPPPDKRPSKMNFAPFEAADEALLSAVPAAAEAVPPPGKGSGEQQDALRGATQLHTAPLEALPLSHKAGSIAVPSIRPLSAAANDDEDIDVSCAVCLEEYHEPVVVVTAQCTHSFCKRCITCWLSMNHNNTTTNAQGPSCPLCKRPVTWLLSLSSSSPPTPPFRFVLLAVGPDAELLEKQPWPSPALLQASRQKQLCLYEARERRKKHRKQQQQQQQEQEKQQASNRKKTTHSDTDKRKGKKREYQPGAGVQQGRSLTESLQEELQRVNAEIALLKTKRRK